MSPSDEGKARLAFIGAGGFATGSLYPNIHLVPQIDLVAVCDIVREKAERNARNFGARHVYTDLEEMLDKEELDGVFVIGPAPQQYELAPHVLRRGIPVYVEKPSANTAAEARELAEIAEANNTWGQCGFMKRFAYVYTIAKDIIARPEFGELNMVSCHFGQGPYPQIWGMDSARRSMLVGQLVHIFDLVRFFGGDVATVQAIYKEVTDTQFAYLVNVRYKSGAIGQLNLNGLETKTGFRDIIERLELVGLGSRCAGKQRTTGPRSCPARAGTCTLMSQPGRASAGRRPTSATWARWRTSRCAASGSATAGRTSGTATRPCASPRRSMRAPKAGGWWSCERRAKGRRLRSTRKAKGNQRRTEGPPRGRSRQDARCRGRPA